MALSIEYVFEIDIISLHIHATPENNKLISKDLLNLLNQDSYLLNTARGEIIDELELVKLLSEHKIAGYAADVVDDECSEKKTPLQEYAVSQPNNLILTPHLGGFTLVRWKAEHSWQKSKDIFGNKFVPYSNGNSLQTNLCSSIEICLQNHINFLKISFLVFQL